MVARGAALERRGDRIPVHQPPPVTAGPGKKHGRFLTGRLAKVIVDTAYDLRCYLVLENDEPRLNPQGPHLLKIEDALLRKISGIDADTDLVGIRVRADDAQRVLQPNGVGIHQIAKQRSLAHGRDKAVHHLVFRSCQRAVKRLVGTHHFMPDGSDRAKQLRIHELRRVI